MQKTLFAFIDFKDPFTPGEIAEEPLPGPILSILAARQFTDVFLFHTPHTAENAEATVHEVRKHHPGCRVDVIDLPVSDPKDYSATMGALGRQVRKIVVGLPDANHSICVSSGTAEMRAAWFLVRAANVLPARLLRVGSPAEPLLGRRGEGSLARSGRLERAPRSRDALELLAANAPSIEGSRSPRTLVQWSSCTLLCAPFVLR